MQVLSVVSLGNFQKNKRMDTVKVSDFIEIKKINLKISDLTLLVLL